MRKFKLCFIHLNIPGIGVLAKVLKSVGLDNLCARDPGSPVFIGSWQNNQFDEMLQTYGTDNVEFNGNYCVVQTLYVDAFGYRTFFWLLMIGWGIFTISIMSKHARKQPHNSTADK